MGSTQTGPCQILVFPGFVPRPAWWPACRIPTKTARHRPNGRFLPASNPRLTWENSCNGRTRAPPGGGAREGVRPVRSAPRASQGHAKTRWHRLAPNSPLRHPGELRACDSGRSRPSIIGMGLFDRMFPRAVTDAAELANAQATVARHLSRSAMLPGIVPPSRAGDDLTLADATSLHSVYRAIEILTGAGSQLSIDSKRSGVILPDPPALLRRPSLDMDRADFIEQTLLSMIVDGNFYWHKKRAPGSTAVLELELWNPYQVFPGRDEHGRRVYSYGGKDYPAADVIHRWRFKLPGQSKGKSVIAAARADLATAVNTRNFASGVFDPGALTNGILKSDQALTGADAKAARRVWNHQDPETGEPIPAEDNPARIRVLGKGMAYEAMTVNPKDAQWIESQGFDVTKIARMFGVPASLMLAAVEGGSQTYANVEQDWIAFVRFTLVGYLRKIESAFTELLPGGQSAVFNLESLLRSDTLTRYQSYAVAPWMTDDEKRAIENLPPLTDAQRATLAAPTAPEGATL